MAPMPPIRVRDPRAARHGLFRLEQIPEIAPWILKHDDAAIHLMSRFFLENHTLGFHGLIVALEIIRVQEKSNPPAGLIADRGGLCRALGLGEQDRGFNPPAAQRGPNAWSGPAGCPREARNRACSRRNRSRHHSPGRRL